MSKIQGALAHLLPHILSLFSVARRVPMDVQIRDCLILTKVTVFKGAGVAQSVEV